MTMVQRDEPPGRAGAEPFEAFYRREVAVLTALATALTGNRDLGADLAHEALLRAYRAWPVVGGYERPGAWVRRVTLNLVADSRRRARREERAVARLAGRADSRAGRSDGEVTDEQFWRAVRALPERQRATVALYYVDDLPVADIAAVLEVTAGTVKAALHAARASLAAALGAEEGTDAHDR